MNVRPNRARNQSAPTADSVQSELALDEVELLQHDEPPAGNTQTVERPIEIGDPVVQEVHELRELRGQVVILPDVALQQSWVVWQSIQDFCRGQGESFELTQKGCLRHGRPCFGQCFLEHKVYCPPWVASIWYRQNQQLAGLSGYQALLS